MHGFAGEKRVGFYDRFVLPPLIDMACGKTIIREQREKIAPQAEGTVLEIGFGSGLNLPLLKPDKVTKLYALEPSAGMLARARKRADSVAFPVEILAEAAEDLSLPPESVDTVLVTYSLCSIPDPLAALAGARRALKPGGKLLFCEHGLAPEEDVRRWQRRIEPVWRVIGGGCHLTRDIPDLVRSAGFTIERLDAGYLPNTPKWAGFNTWGCAQAA